MHSRTLRVAFILLWSVWFGLIIPGHQRGIVALPGTQQASGECPVLGGDSVQASCCKSQPGRGDPVRHCAICKLVAMLDIPAAVNNDVPPLGLVGLADPVAPIAVYPPSTVSVHTGRAPPLS